MGATEIQAAGKCHLDEVLVRLCRAEDAAVGRDRVPIQLKSSDLI